MLHLIKWHNVTHKSSWPDLFLKNAVPLVSFVYNLNLKARLCRHIWTSQEAQCLCRIVLPLGGCSSVTGCIRQLSALPWGATVTVCTQWGMQGAAQPQVERENHLHERWLDSSVCTLSGRELLTHIWSFPGGSAVKNLPVMQVQSLGWGDSLEQGVATRSSILAWRIPWTEESGGLQSIGMQSVRYDESDWARTSLLLPTYCLYKLFVKSGININNQQYDKFMNKKLHTHTSQQTHMYTHFLLLRWFIPQTGE